MRKFLKLTVNKINIIIELRKTKCIINWVDAYGTKRRSVGVALQHPDDLPNRELGIRLAESRAKVDMFKKHLDSLPDVTLKFVFEYDKYKNALKHELHYIDKLLNNES